MAAVYWHIASYGFCVHVPEGLVHYHGLTVCQGSSSWTDPFAGKANVSWSVVAPVVAGCFSVGREDARWKEPPVEYVARQCFDCQAVEGAARVGELGTVLESYHDAVAIEPFGWMILSACMVGEWTDEGRCAKLANGTYALPWVGLGKSGV